MTNRLATFGRQSAMIQFLALLVPIFTVVVCNAALVETSTPVLSEEIVSSTIDEVTKFLDGTGGEGDEQLEAMNQTMRALELSVKDLETLSKQIAEAEARVKELLHKTYTHQVEDLVERLREILERETNLRQRENAIANQRSSSAQIAPDADTESEDDSAMEVTKEALTRRLDPDTILGDSESLIKTWVLEVIEEELADYRTKLFDDLPRIDALEKILDSKTAAINGGDESCPTTASLVQMVQQALNKHADDGIGKVDHAQGASVVHWLTSETHTPRARQTLGSVWWNKFIPQDWERLLPQGWETWDIGLPSYLHHSFGFLSGDVAPPEAILQKNTLPGSCWPMVGNRGQVVLKLKHPIVVESVTIDHVSKDIVPEGKQYSAPKHLKIIGYPSCDQYDGEQCQSVGFNLEDPMEIADIQYNLEAGVSIQTFQSHFATAMASVPSKPPIGHDDDGGSCSTVEASCSTPPRIPVAGVGVQVLENWGNKDFTCLYRVRLHGEIE